ncbi:branched-chain amino acid ABC transporter ATP-binding protein/permease [Tardiphaga alba]|uniref:Branched-chain amino acid ABC transporter ATP-binding protein/permease n=2 Tax=Tardiphaga alba TaxID=340268 RepID=A0ABX8AF77_9BRAD|nr:branched-chain amino acid ABC transporter ATP-binding protein/permease [Tardiphaga alba]
MKRFVEPVAFLLVLALAVSGVLSSFTVALINDIAIASLVALGLVVLTGVGGMTSFGQAAFVGLGAYTTAVLTVRYGLSPWLALAASIVVTGGCALLIGAVTVRLSGHYLPLGTIAWGISFYYLFGNIEWLGRHDGISGIPPLTLGNHAITGQKEYLILTLGVLFTAILLTRNLLRGRVGRAVRSLRDGTHAAEAFGVHPSTVKLIVFVFAAMLAAIAGWLYAHFQRSVSPGPFGITAGTEYLLMAVLGGAGRIYGAVLGAALVILLRDQLQSWLPHLLGAGNYETIIFGAALVLLLRGASDGLWAKIAGREAAIAFDSASGVLTASRKERPAKDTKLLELRHLKKVFGGLIAVNDVTFAVPAGRIVGLIGPNGAGKSTTFNLATGVLTPTSGEVCFCDEALKTISPQEMARLGVGRSFQHPEIMTDMSVVENVMLGAHLRGHAGAVKAMLGLDRKEELVLHAIAWRMLQRTGLEKVALSPAGTLSLGQLRLLEVARALALDPLIVLLDEPAAGLRVCEKRELARLLRELRQEGVAVLMVEHDMDFVMSLADHLIVLDFGNQIAEGDANGIRSNPRVLDAYLGGPREQFLAIGKLPFGGLRIRRGFA